ncbi:DUF4279 domain-containing protein [Streptomyces tanashiensis]|uniref:DUF4279 domain-containing protein n=1 Tax=Streptomyces tanashiensis TaxID=67367 RepID=UPI003427502E
MRSARGHRPSGTALLGVQPDETKVRGSRVVEPAIPACHQWRIVCREPGLRVDEQIALVLDRLRPHTDRIAGLAGRMGEEPGAGRAAKPQIVRYYTAADDPGENRSCSPRGRLAAVDAIRDWATGRPAGSRPGF